MGFVVGHKIIVRRVISRPKHGCEEPLAITQSEESDLFPGLDLQKELSNIEAVFCSPSPFKDIVVAKIPATAPSGAHDTTSTSDGRLILPSD